jgi:hypothetical protein
VRKRYLLGAAVSALALAFAAVALASPTLQQKAEVKYTKSKSRASVGIDTDLATTDPAANPPGNIPPVDKVVFRFRGARYDYRGAPQCSASQAQRAACPRRANIGSGTAEANLVGTNPATGQTSVQPLGTLNVSAFNGRGRIYLVIRQTGTVLKPRITKNGTLTTDVKGDTPPLPGGNKVVLTSFKLKTRAKSRRVRGKRRFLIRAPRCTRSRRWRISVRFTYADGDSRSFNVRQRCRR